MSIQWYPGHMHKAQKEIKQNLHKMDLIIEVVDARIPLSSSNPVIADLTSYQGKNTPLIRLMNKCDLASESITQLWKDYFSQQNSTQAISINAQQTSDIKKIIPLAKKLMPQKVSKQQPINAMIMGIPNVGKSTIINALAGRKIAKVGNEPAVTQRQQRIDLQALTLFDTPGILWPKIENQSSSYRLAITGAIKDTALSYDEIAFFLIDYLKANFADVLRDKYQLETVDLQTEQLMEDIGKKRGCLASGGRVDLDKVSKIIIHDYRAGKLTNISLETPDMILEELKQVELNKTIKQQKRAQRKQNFKNRMQ